MIDTDARIEFLKKSHLFLGLKDEELTAIANELGEDTYSKGQAIYDEGSPAGTLEIIFQGRVNFTRLDQGKPVKMHAMVKGDYFGEEGLIRGQVRDRSAMAEVNTTLLSLNRKAYIRLLKTAPGLRHNIEVMTSSRQLAAQLNYTWLNENEIIFFLARKHRFLLFQALILPAIFLLPVIILIVLAFLFSSATLGLLGGFSLVAVLAWGLWRGIDWGNDYYIVTNQRVIWLEKVIAFYDSRTEAGMGTILSVNTDTELFSRMFDFGTVVVRTYTGQIRMQYVRHPKQAAALIEELLTRTKEEGKRATEESMKKAIRLKLGFEKPPEKPAKPQTPAKPARKPNPIAAWWKNAFKMRVEDGNIITYHKHIFGFFRDASPYAFGIFVLCGVVLGWPFLSFTSGNIMPLWLGTLFMVGVLVLFGFIVYVYMDWENDIYQVTPDQIIDIYKKPFGTEDRRVAALENILSTEYKRTGFFGIVFNYGTVYVMVGTEAYNFEDVADPPSVQQDIIRRQMGSRQKKADAAAALEQNRMTDWLAMYHSTVSDHEKESGEDGSVPPNSG